MGDTIKHKMKIRILGTEYSVIADDDPARIETVAGFVDKMAQDMKNCSARMTNLEALVLASLNLTQELYNVKDELSAMKEHDEEYQVLINYKDKLTGAMQEIHDNATKYKVLQSRLERMEQENDELNDLIYEYKQKFHILRTEYEMNKRKLNELEDKMMKNQIDLVNTRKSLLDYD